jgi:cellulose synthase/poly-beta-1,6-N-acetylglucosamine synthase-like glycosyltransferase/spore germination protein YaaH/peptidoglycan/xylan/chitin deacetylase (PgdA/CDA1 family)
MSARDRGPGAQVFRDATGRRWRRVRWFARVAGVVSSILALALVAAILAPPLLPVITGGTRGQRDLVHLPNIATTKRERARIAARRRLFVERGGRRGPAALRPGALPLGRGGARAVPGDSNRIVAAFYVNWDDNSWSSFRTHVADMDWVVCEWAFIAPGGDSVRLRIDPRVLYLAARQPAGSRPAVLSMVTNFDSASHDFDAGRLRRLVGSPARRARVIAQLDSMVASYGLAGVTIDFEAIPPELEPGVNEFVGVLARTLHRRGAIVTQALPADAELDVLRAAAAANDRLFLMLYDEHYGAGDPGPVASEGWYERLAKRALRVVPPAKAILAIGAYGYDWTDATPAASGDERTFQDVMRAARSHGATVHFDSLSRNPWVSYTDPDSTDHVVWFLDAATASNEAAIGEALGAAGHAIWRLGGEDPALWDAIGAHSSSTSALDSIPPGYDVEFDGSGEVLRLTARPTTGRRVITRDRASGLVSGEQYVTFPTPYVVSRLGNVPHHVALTFDDGPDARWTPLILDTLKKYHTPATFFVIGENAEAHIPLVRRMVREGHEFGNHTFSHPNLALTSTFVTRLELDATERLLEALLDRRSALFRPPYFGDAEPTTADELDPVGVASDLGYVTVGLHVDSEDWTEPGTDEIVRNVLDGRTRAQACLDSLHRNRPAGSPLEDGCSGSVVLLHDGGGDRSQTLAALGPLIDSLRARGDTLVLVSALAGLTPAQAMPGLPPSGAAVRLAELTTFGAIGIIEWLLHWLFLLAVVLGLGRLVIITALALVQNARARRAREIDVELEPVTVIVPAYNEEKVIAKTVGSLLEQDYPGPLRIVVVDDGSPDGTAAVVRAIYGEHPRVEVHRKPNGGKASALNYGISLTAAPIIVALDADTQFETDTITRLVAPLADPRVGAVAGNAKVGNRVNLVTRWQAVEYVTSQNLDRRAFALLDCITVVPGAVGAWRRQLAVAAGGFSEDTLAEDQDLTLAIRRQGYSVAYAADAIAYTEAPETLRGLAKQRFRWSFGTLQCMWKHRDALYNPRYGTLGWIAMPNVWLFQLLFAALSPLADLLFVWSLFSVWLVREQHGATYALTNLEQVLTLYAIFLVVDWLAAALAFIAEPDEDKRLTWLVFLQRFAYRQVMYWVVLRSFIAAVRGHVVGWGKLDRTATVQRPA